MLELKKCNVDGLRKYIDIAFNNDYELLEYFDKSVQVEGRIDNMAESVIIKLKDFKLFFDNCYSYSVNLDGNPIGYLFLLKDPNILVSFSIEKQYRNKEILKEYFEIIKNEFEGDFSCFLYPYNTRAINWLKKCGMVLSNDVLSEEFLKLTYKK